ncbi:MAG: hypothetical protein ACFNLD_10415, partial [Kingella oralis]
QNPVFSGFFAPTVQNPNQTGCCCKQGLPRLRLCPLHIGDNLGDIGDKYENTHCRPYAADKGIEFCLAYHDGKSPYGV